MVAARVVAAPAALEWLRAPLATSASARIHRRMRRDAPTPRRRAQAPLRYADDTNMPTETYPFNPNGSPHGIAALCSKDGRHLALMPHPERCFVKWQLPWMPEHQAEHDAAPWLQLFQNAFDFASK